MCIRNREIPLPTFISRGKEIYKKMYGCPINETQQAIIFTWCILMRTFLAISNLNGDLFSHFGCSVVPGGGGGADSLQPPRHATLSFQRAHGQRLKTNGLKVHWGRSACVHSYIRTWIFFNELACRNPPFPFRAKTHRFHPNSLPPPERAQVCQLSGGDGSAASAHLQKMTRFLSWFILWLCHMYWWEGFCGGEWWKHFSWSSCV